MGAPGKAFFCKQGHLFHWIEEDQYWDHSLIQEERNIRSKGCPCGNKEITQVFHYGDMNDCCTDDTRIEFTEMESVGLEPILDAVDSQVSPIVAFRPLVLPKYYLPEYLRNK